MCHCCMLVGWVYSRVESSCATVACWWAECIVELSHRVPLLHAGGLGV